MSSGLGDGGRADFFPLQRLFLSQGLASDGRREPCDFVVGNEVFASHT